MASTYISCYDFVRAPTGLEFTTLISNQVRIGGSGAVSGAQTLNILAPGLTADIAEYGRLAIFDGPNSEIITITSAATAGSQTVQCSDLQFSHFVGTPVCGDGIVGSLADAIFSSGQLLETICRQSLYNTTYVNEKLSLPTMRASIDENYDLFFRPRHWPVQSITNVAINVTAGDSIAFDPAQVIIDSDRQVCSMPNMLALPVAGSGQSPYPIWNVPSRNRKAQVVITYTAGFPTIPNDVTEAAILLASDVLAKRQNPIGAPDLSSGGRHISAAVRGDNSGDSLLSKRAKKILDNYMMQAF
ncbi:MAG TPA: hypothetical protein VL443_08340 [Cyclobacteriaceae bacterium]|jgi:hypothetical protein|nr:hypothetical protein [Cyclobacteriaceae bacterium]